MEIIVATIVRNEADRYLESALECWLTFADRILAIEDGSDDETRDLLSSDPRIHIAERPEMGPMWTNEHPYRRKLFNWSLAESSPGDIVFFEDADMCPIRDPSDIFASEIADAYAFNLYDFWHSKDDNFWYRCDGPWKAHDNWRVWAFRRSAFDLPWIEFEPERRIHTGHMPLSWFEGFKTIYWLPPEYGIGHYGYLDPTDREEKEERYLSVRESLKPAELAHTLTITESAILTSLTHPMEMKLHKP